MRRLSSFSRHSFGVRNRAPWRSILSHTFHQFHENDLFTSAAAMSYFGLLTLFPALLLILGMSNRLTAGSAMMAQIVQVYPGSADFHYELTEELIAQLPLKRPEASSMLVLELAAPRWQDGLFTELPGYLREG